MQLIKNSIVYLSGDLINRSVPFLLLPVLTHYLTPEEYGLISIYLIVITFYNAFIGMNMHMNVTRNFAFVSKAEIAVFVGCILIIGLVSFIAYFLLTFLGVGFTDEVFSIPGEWLVFVPLICLLMLIGNTTLTVLRNENKPFLYIALEGVNTLMKLVLTIVLLIVYGSGWYSQALGVFFGHLLVAVAGLYYLYRSDYLNFKLDRVKVRSILGISIPVIPHVVGGVVIAMSDRLFIEHMVGLDAVGIYSVGYMIGMCVVLFSDAFIKAWAPWFYVRMAAGGVFDKQQIVRYTYFYVAAVFLVAMIVTVLGELLLPFVVAERYLGASVFILWIALGYAVHGLYKILHPYIVHMAKTAFLSFSTLVAAILNMVFNYLLIGHFGTIGAAYATLLAFSVSTVLVFCYQRLLVEMPWGEVLMTFGRRRTQVQ